MRSEHVVFKNYDQMLADLMANNQQGRLSVGFMPQLFAALTIADRTALCHAISQNTSLTQFFFENCVIDNDFVVLLRDALEKNTTITTLSFHTPSDTLEETLNDIARFLKRNRQLALDAPLAPSMPASNTAQFNEMAFPAIFQTALDAAQSGDLNLLHACITHTPSLVHIASYNTDTLLKKASIYGHVPCVKYLLKAGANVDFTPEEDANHFGTKTALFHAVRNSHYVVTELLLKARANVNAVNTATGYNILHEVSDDDIADLLVQHRANIRAITEIAAPYGTRGTTVLHATNLHHSPSLKLLNRLLQQAELVNYQNADGATALYFMTHARLNFDETFAQRLTLFLRAGANPLLRNLSGYIPAHCASPEYKKMVLNITKDYAAINTLAVVLKQGHKPKCIAQNSLSFFFALPKHCLEKIIDEAVDTTEMDKETKAIVIRKALR